MIYDLQYYGRLPEMHAWGTWHASEFYRFFQDINTEDNFWSEDSYTEIISSSRYKNEVTKTQFDFVAEPGLSAGAAGQVRSWRSRNMINKQLDAGGPAQPADRRSPRWTRASRSCTEGQDIEDVQREVSKTQIANVRVEWTEAKAIITEKNPQGMLPTVTSSRTRRASR